MLDPKNSWQNLPNYEGPHNSNYPEFQRHAARVPKLCHNQLLNHRCIFINLVCEQIECGEIITYDNG
jgi:hypothetical protein